MAHRSQCSSAGDNPLDPNYLPPHYREEYRLAIDSLIEEDLEGYYQFLQKADVVDFLSSTEIQYIQSSVQLPQQSNYPEQHFVDTGGDGSSDTYWPIHSDLEAPGLDLGWPQLHHFIGPTEVTTLVNPPEPNMPSIKEQARRLIKNAQQVIAIVMDMFTDVDMFADILDAAMRNVAVYILLDKQNAHHFFSMVSNCRVNLQNIQFLRVRTVSGITYHCRSGNSFKGQMMDRFLLTDCRAVLSGNYSFMWSFEKLHRCMAHLFLGQLVSTFDEEFRILFAQSEPAVIEHVIPMEDERTLYREQKQLQSLDTVHPEEWPRHSYDERMDVDWRMMPLKKQESMHGPADIYSRFTPQQSRMDPSFNQRPIRMPMLENPAFKRHSYAEGTHGRNSYLFLQQQGMPEPENQGRPLYRVQQPGPGPEKEADYSGYDKFWNQDFHSPDQHFIQPGLPQEMEPADNFDPVLNYLASTRNADFDQGSEKLLPAADVPFGSSHPRRLSLGQPHAYQTSPTPSNPDQKQFLQEPNADRKDPMVKRGLRNWRISSYLSAYDNPGDEGLPSAPIYAPDTFEEPPYPIQQTPGIDLSVSKIPNVREFKVPAIPRASQMPSYAKTTAREQPKKLPDEPTAVEAETKITPTPSESSSTTEVEKIEESEQKEPKTAFLRREESFRRKYNAAVPRSSRLRSSLIFSSLEQQHTNPDTKTASGQQDEEIDKNEAEQTKLPFVFGQRRSAREPFEWSRYMKSATIDNAATDPSQPDDGNSKPDDKESPKDKNSKDLSEVQDSLKPPDEERANSSPSLPQSKASEAELSKTDQPVQPHKSLLATPGCVDMNDPDKRLMFFKELAAKRKAEQAAEAEKAKEKAQLKPPTELKNNTTVKKEEPVPKESSEKRADVSTYEGLLAENANAEDAGKTVFTEACESVSVSLEASNKTNKQDSQVKTDPNTSKSCKQEQTIVSPNSEKIELKSSQSAATLPVSAETEALRSEPSVEPKLSNPAVKTSSPSHPPTPTNSTPSVPPLAQGTDQSDSLDSTSKESSSLTPSSVEVPPSSAFAALDSNTENPESVQKPETSLSSPPVLLPEQHTGSEVSSSNPSGQSSSSDHILPHSGSQMSPTASPSSCASLSTPAETISSNGTPGDSSSTLTSSILPPKVQESVCPSPPEPSKLTSPETLSAADSAHVESDVSPDTCAAGSEPNTSSLQSSTKTDSKESCAPTPPEKDVPESENNSVPRGVGEESEVLGSSKDVNVDSTPPSLSTSLPESRLPNVSDLESKSTSAQNETITPTPSPADNPPKHCLAETSSPVHLDFTPNPSQSERQATPPSKLNLTGSPPPSPADTVSRSSPLTVSVLSPEAEKTLAALHSPSDTNSLLKQIATDSTETPKVPATETFSPTEPDLPCKTPESVTSETHSLESPVTAENSNMDSQNEVSKEPKIPDAGEKKSDDTEVSNKENIVDSTTQESVCNEKTNDQVRQNNSCEPPEITSDEVVPLSLQSKQPKSSQSRYQSSTANVLSSSNLRDDTKLLLEQISANNQSRNEAAKESPVTDDEKEGKADKNAKREQEKGISLLNRGQPKTSQEREKLLERIQSMRKDRKVYSRFEMAP
ncbi:protein FAM83H isoform X2 [Sander lucioperca]|uniref:protein FAM83H isoform X2 n=1 Tax=Sander lucioperca TaxID=283035 RepID=UPI001653ACE8|nr:protein FAM83H isoform X2 [Sander lucioperca]